MVGKVRKSKECIKIYCITSDIKWAHTKMKPCILWHFNISMVLYDIPLSYLKMYIVLMASPTF